MNDPPVLTYTGTELVSFTEDGIPTKLFDGVFVVADDDHLFMQQAIVSIDNPVDNFNGEKKSEWLNYFGDYDHVVDFDTDGTQALSLSGRTRNTIWAELFNTIVYENVDQGPSNDVIRTVSVVVKDLNGAESNVITVRVQLVAVNDAPQLSDMSQALTDIAEDITSEDNAGVSISELLAADHVDFDDEPLFGIAVTGLDAANGAWQFMQSGS